jgi:endonuclease-3
MVAAQRHKSPDKQEVCRKVTSLLKKAYAGAAPKRELPVLETLLYAVCLENNSVAQADAVYARLLNAFHDLNEVRVSSITELQPVFDDVAEPEWRALRVKSTLQYVFESNYAFDFESLKRKTTELAIKQLSKIHSLSHFVRAYVLQHSLDSHVLPIDARMHAALTWLGLAEPGATSDQVAEALRPFVRKADAPQFCHLLRSLATDPKRMRAFAAGAKEKEKDAVLDGDPVARLDALLRRRDVPGRARSRPRKETARKPAKNGSHRSRSARSRVGTKKRR